MRVSLRHPNASHSFLDEGSAFGQQLLQLCVENKIETQTLGRKGATLNPIESSSAVGKSLQRIHAIGSKHIIEKSFLDFGKSRELEFNACHLHSGGNVHHMQKSKGLNVFLRDTFHSVIDSMHMYGFSTSLSRFDLFHGHLFRSDDIVTSCSTTSQSLLGILFHCAEFPMGACEDAVTNTTDGSQKETKPILEGVDLGYCQQNSDCRPSLQEWRFRNALWSAWWPSQSDSNGKVPPASLQQAIWLLDGASPGMAKLRVDGTEFGPDCPNSVNEDFLGSPIGDLFLLNDDLYFTPRVLHGLSSFYPF
jgi:hypothetical protein